MMRQTHPRNTRPSPRQAARVTPHSAPRTPRSNGFTLVELMVVVLIITILATIVLSALQLSMETASANRTRSQIQRIHNLIAPIWEQYRTRRVSVPIVPGTGPRVAAEMRLDALRELMRLELPDRKSDVVDPPSTAGMPRPALSQAYLRKANNIPGGIAAWSLEHQGAECLYMILSRIQDGDTNGLEFVRETEIGDVDGDGMQEILDGWGTPIRFLRWAPGWWNGNQGAVSNLQKDPAVADPDAFDPTGVRGTPPTTYFLFPLVMSAGPDREWDIVFDGMTAIQYSNTSPNKNDPYNSHGLARKIGAPDDNNGNNSGTPQEHKDNIHNHLLVTGVQ